MPRNTSDTEIYARAAAYIDGSLALTDSEVSPAERELAIGKVVAWTKRLIAATEFADRIALLEELPEDDYPEGSGPYGF